MILQSRAARLVAFALAPALAGIALPAGAGAAEVNVYTYREKPLIQPLFDKFTKETGIAVNVVYGSKGLEERIKAEGAASPADLLITADVALLERARDLGITQPVVTPELEKVVPQQFRDPAGNWVGLTYRARVVYASKDRVKDDHLSYADLTDPKWKGKLCTRSGQHPYNIALIGAAIAHWGPEKAEAWVRGLKANLAVKPAGNDRSQVKAIFAGECDIALGNTYYYGLMANNDKEPEQKEWAKAVKVIFPTFETGGSHVNISGAALAKNAPNKDAAAKLIAFMIGEEAQETYASLNYEYPVKAGVPVAETIKALGPVTPDTLHLGEVAKNRAAAADLVDKVGFDNGPGS